MSGRTRRFFSGISREKKAYEQVEDILEKVGLGAVKNSPATALSHGDQRLLEVGVALAVNPTAFSG